jgi:cobyrinic acid a,c-diamide synthase
MATRTVAAVILGCQVFDRHVDIAGVILNRVAGKRQENLIRNAVEKYCGIPVVGSVPKLGENPFPERHMGLVPYQEREQSEKALSWARDVVKNHVDIDLLSEIAHRSEGLPSSSERGVLQTPMTGPLRVGFIRDRSFWFYYPENLDYLARMGATLVEINALEDSALPCVDALYIGGGFPETQAEALSANVTFRESLREEIENGLPVYAECGGLMYLGESLVLGGKTHPMVGALPIRFVLEEKPQGHGYTLLEVVYPNPFHPVGKTLKGHEFHYSRAEMTRKEEGLRFAFKILRGHGLDGKRDGICKKNLLATYTHIHAAGNPEWARRLLKAASSHHRDAK